ncbi:hypothetical protein NBRC110019_13820 [Neptunitalea chrysea]|uniref:Uncharacterized protein n=1 Tax=Neptunitalea chrysea TaxID=1647581 RepID=A0A9W6EVC0_9FLAO|nr:hypothetical protein [Neptunitalea chrysea]GLB52342.1 hypothetical protein NBRC110019_13820 [Neptunitalea chrysea]
MKTRYLFPHRYKNFGWILFGVSIVLGIMMHITNDLFDGDSLIVPFLAIYNDPFLGSDGGQFFQIIKTGIFDELLITGIIFGGVLVGFSKLKIEDEFTSKLRSESLIWAFYVTSILNVLISLFIYGGIYLTFLVYNLFFQLIFFIIRFHYVLYKSNKEMSYEE